MQLLGLIHLALHQLCDRSVTKASKTCISPSSRDTTPNISPRALVILYFVENSCVSRCSDMSVSSRAMYEELVCPCRPELWFWDSVVLLLTLALAASQVFATALDTYFQLTIMLMILTVGVTAFAHFQPFTDDLLQRMQVNAAFWRACGTVSAASEPSLLGCIDE